MPTIVIHGAESDWIDADRFAIGAKLLIEAKRANRDAEATPSRAQMGRRWPGDA
jgi:hypothetical protein